MPNKIHICAIVVTYYPNLGQLQQLLDRLSKQVEHVVIIDNGLTLMDLIRTDSSRTLIIPGTNVGVATAINQGIVFASDAGYTHVLLMDQDSEPASDMVSQLLIVENMLTDRGVKVAATGPQYLERQSGRVAPFIQISLSRVKRIYTSQDNNNLDYVESDFLITSGSLIAISALKAIGKMRDGLFIDNVDLEWCFRAREQHYCCIGVFSAKMHHSIGENRKPFLFGLRDQAVHPPSRLYYMMRNRVILYSLAHTPKFWILHDIPRLIFKFLLFTALIPNRVTNFRAMTRGLRDGISKVEGPLAYPFEN